MSFPFYNWLKFGVKITSRCFVISFSKLRTKRSCDEISWHGMVFHGTLCHIMAPHVIIWHPMLFHGTPRYNMAPHVIIWHPMSYHGTLCYNMAPHVIIWHPRVISLHQKQKRVSCEGGGGDHTNLLSRGCDVIFIKCNNWGSTSWSSLNSKN